MNMIYFIIILSLFLIHQKCMYHMYFVNISYISYANDYQIINVQHNFSTLLDSNSYNFVDYD